MYRTLRCAGGFFAQPETFIFRQRVCGSVSALSDTLSQIERDQNNVKDFHV